MSPNKAHRIKGVLYLYYLVICAVIVLLGFSAWDTWKEFKASQKVDIDSAQVKGQGDSGGERAKEKRASLRTYEPITRKNIFGGKAVEPREEKVSISEIPTIDKSLHLKLWGTVVGEDPKHNIAVIEDKRKKKQEIYWEGNWVNRAKIKRILRFNVVLEIDGEHKVLTMDRK